MFRILISALGDVADLDPSTQTALLNDRLGDCLRASGLGSLAVLGPGRVLVNVRGTLSVNARPAPAGVELRSGALRIDLSDVVFKGSGYAELADVLDQYEMEGHGAYVWFVADGFLAGLSSVEEVWAADGGAYFSHESICVLNTGDRRTRCRLDVYYEDLDREPVSNEFDVGPKRSVHHRLDRLTDQHGEPLIAKDAPVGYKLTSFDARVIVQSSRILTSGRGSEFASFGTATAWAPMA